MLASESIFPQGIGFVLRCINKLNGVNRVKHGTGSNRVKSCQKIDEMKCELRMKLWI